MRLLRTVAALVLALAAATSATSAEKWDATLVEVDSLFESFAARTHAPGLIYGVVRDGKLAHVHAVGMQDLDSRAPVTADTVFRIASLTKSFTALAVLKLRDEGRLDLNAPAAKLVPQLRIAGDGTAPVLVRHLLTHSAGLVTDDPWGDRQLDLSEPAFSAFLQAGVPLARPPGEAFEYSNTGYAVLGRLITNVSGRRYQEYISQILLRPLGMNATVWEPREIPAKQRAIGYSWIDDHFEAQPALSDGAFGAMAGLSTTASDYSRYVAWLLSAWQAPSARRAVAIDPATVREAGRGSILSQVGQRQDGPDGKPCPVAWMYGAGFYVVTDCELGVMLRHPGGLPGYGSQVLLLPQAGVGLFAFANLTYAHLSDPVVEAAVRLKRAGLLANNEPAPSPTLQHAAAAALRMYQAGDIAAIADELTPNVLLDRSGPARNLELQRLRAAVGACTVIAPREIQHTMAGRFDLTCEHGTLGVSLLLAPTSPPKIQYLAFEPPATPASDGKPPSK